MLKHVSVKTWLKYVQKVAVYTAFSPQTRHQTHYRIHLSRVCPLPETCVQSLLAKLKT
jgi:hypothetical protein